MAFGQSQVQPLRLLHRRIISTITLAHVVSFPALKLSANRMLTHPLCYVQARFESWRERGCETILSLGIGYPSEEGTIPRENLRNCTIYEHGRIFRGYLFNQQTFSLIPGIFVCM